MGNKLFNNKGLTLVELVITIAMLGIIISFMFTYFQLNYDTFIRSNVNYNLQTDLNYTLRLIEEKLRFTENIKLENNGDSKIEFGDSNESSIYLENKVIKITTNKNIKHITDIDAVLIDELSFKLNKNLLIITIKGKSPDMKDELEIESTIELLNITEGVDQS